MKKTLLIFPLFILNACVITDTPYYDTTPSYSYYNIEPIYYRTYIDRENTVFTNDNHYKRHYDKKPHKTIKNNPPQKVDNKPIKKDPPKKITPAPIKEVNNCQKARLKGNQSPKYKFGC